MFPSRWELLDWVYTGRFKKWEITSIHKSCMTKKDTIEYIVYLMDKEGLGKADIIKSYGIPKPLMKTKLKKIISSAYKGDVTSALIDAYPEYELEGYRMIFDFFAKPKLWTLEKFFDVLYCIAIERDGHNMCDIYKSINREYIKKNNLETPYKKLCDSDICYLINGFVEYCKKKGDKISEIRPSKKGQA